MGYSYGILGAEVYLVALLIVLITNFATPPMLKYVFEHGSPTKHIEFRWKKLLRRRGGREHAKR